MRKLRLGLSICLVGLLLGLFWLSMWLADSQKVCAVSSYSPVSQVETSYLDEQTVFYTTTLVIPTYPYASYLSTATNLAYNMDYQVLDWGGYEAGHPVPVPVPYTLLVLENAYLKVSILPELGGRIYQLIYKATGNNELYQNPVIKPTVWGPLEQGWWLAVGGIEWALPVDEHGYEWGMPWDWRVVTSTAGVTATLCDTWATDRLRAKVDIFLPAERAYLAVSPHLENPTDHNLEYKFWLNAMLTPGSGNALSSGLQFVFSADEVSIHSTGDDRLPGAHKMILGPEYRISWPVYNGVDYSRLENWDAWLGFFEYPEAANDFVGVYNYHGGEGVVRVFPSEIARGAKGFGMGWQHSLNPDIWTDDGSAYVELHGGIAPTFWDHAYLEAGDVISWTECWYPFGEIGALSAATGEGALGLRFEGDVLHVGVHPTRAWDGDASQIYLWERQTCVEIGRYELPAVGPSESYELSVASVGYALEDLAVAYTDSAGSILVDLNPQHCFPLPAVPRLALQPTSRFFMVSMEDRDIFTTSVEVLNLGSGSLTWTAEVDQQAALVPNLLTSQGSQNGQVLMAVDPTDLELGRHTGGLTVTATSSDVLDSPQLFRLELLMVPRLSRLFLPLVLRGFSSP